MREILTISMVHLTMIASMIVIAHCVLLQGGSAFHTSLVLLLEGKGLNSAGEPVFGLPQVPPLAFPFLSINRHRP